MFECVIMEGGSGLGIGTWPLLENCISVSVINTSFLKGVNEAEITMQVTGKDRKHNTI